MEHDLVKDDNTANLNEIVREQSKTIETLVKQVTGTTGTPRPQTIFNTTPVATKKPFNFVLVGAIGLAVFFFLRR